MKLYFHHADSLLKGIALVSDDLGFTLADQKEADIIIDVQKLEKDGVSIRLSGNRATIAWGGKARFFRGLAILMDWLKQGETDKFLAETPLFATNGAMVDMSRNAVMNVKTVKFMLRKMALMGLNTFMLYTEDTYEVENRPYFGHMRGRYTRDEIKEMDAYALALGIELIPCIQLLGHLATMLRWRAAAPYKDTANALLAGAEETYALIDDLLSSIAACFTSRRLHMGMDETHDLGTGRSLDLNGYTPRNDLYFSHLNKVVEMAKAHGFAPMMWSDMFFRMSASDIPDFQDYDVRTKLPENIRSFVPDGVQQVFWDYYHPDEEFYAVNLEKHDLLGDHTLFAGGVWCWSGHCPQYSRSIRNSVPALDACRKKGTREVIATVWHNGSESCLIMSLAGLAMYADYDYKGKYDVDSIRECFRFSCGQEYDDFMKMEDLEYPHGNNFYTGSSRAMLYNDPLLGLVDKQIEGLETKEFYSRISANIANAGPDSGEFKPAFDVIRKLCSVLENKADFGIRLKAAYDAKDMQALSALALECDVISEKIQALRKAHRAAWMLYHKAFGWEIHDIRYGGLIMRFDTVKEMILEYLAGKIEKIDELEEVRLRHDGRAVSEEHFNGDFLWNQYQTIATTGGL
ncbi:MAG: beta-N-acetylhexosaminidase [Clostridia bacterium]|nr:beta-N-acetylhexosaminidase [Clostridia bacterium]